MDLGGEQVMGQSTERQIVIRGAREHNLRNLDLELPREQFITITGVSGSGKSSLAFDTLFAEGQRAYVASLSAYARNFLDKLERPEVDSIEGLSPAIAIEQGTTSRNPRSTVGTVTEIHDHLRLLFARLGHPSCPQCGHGLRAQTVDEIVDLLLALPEATQIWILAPLTAENRAARGRELLAESYLRFRVDGRVQSYDAEATLNWDAAERVEVVLDRIRLRAGRRARLGEAVEAAYRIGQGIVRVVLEGEDAPWQEQSFTEGLYCVACDEALPLPEPRNFSFNSPAGACPACGGLGLQRELDEALIVPDPSLSIAAGGLVGMPKGGSYYTMMLAQMGERYGFSVDEPLAAISPANMQIILYGSEEEIDWDIVHPEKQRQWKFTRPWEGVIPWFKRRYLETKSEGIRRGLESLMSEQRCRHCEGKRLRPESLAFRVGGLDIAELSALSIWDLVAFFERLELSKGEAEIARLLLAELRGRLAFLNDVGLGYLSLERGATTLSGGESQRIRLATQLGSSLTGVLYVLDEPSIGLHAKDNARLLKALRAMRDRGNTVVVVEHDEETMRAADWVVELGPGAGRQGGELVYSGPLADMCPEHSLTAAYLSGAKRVRPPGEARRPDRWLELKGATMHNLKEVDIDFPLHCMCCVTGASGSGKSTAVIDILYRALRQQLHRANQAPGPHRALLGVAQVDKVVAVDQSPIGRSPRSNPATYVGVFDVIRGLFSKVPEARARGYKAGRFSFNVKGGRCERCKGDGVSKIEMHFLPDVHVRCEACKGQRYNQETLEILYKGKTIAQVLELSVAEAAEFFAAVPSCAAPLKLLEEVGLGYLALGQAATTLSGGEAQRLKLARELSKKQREHTLYVLDEPTTGLHFADIQRLLQVLFGLRDQGHSVLVIEHNLDFIACADWIIDMGPGGGAQGGQLVAAGPPEQVAEVEASATGACLRAKLSDSPS